MSSFRQGRHLRATAPLLPVVPSAVEAVGWAGATWVGEIDEGDLDDGWQLLLGGADFQRARLLVWRGEQPLGMVEVPVKDGGIDLDVVHQTVAQLPQLPPHRTGGPQPPISVVVCTRDRPGQLAELLASLAGLAYPEFEIIVVDNNPASGLTPPVVDSVGDTQVRLVCAAAPGLSIARNVGLQTARHNIVAFTDDDVVVDRRWLANLAAGFSRDRRAACVCGMVPTRELSTPAQDYFDRRVSWAQRWAPAVYRLDTGVADDHLFPLRVSEFGTGANFAVRKDLVTALGGFDEALGAGAPTRSGEDIDLFLRVLASGHTLVREPSAVVWHSHRRTVPELEHQVYGYSVGLSAWIFKLLLAPSTFTMVMTRLFRGLGQLRKVTAVEQGATAEVDPRLAGLRRRELAGVMRGPWALLRGRLAGRRAAPLSEDKSRLPSRLAVTAAVLGLVGSFAGPAILPGYAAAVVVTAFLLAGPGCLALSWYPQLPTYAKVALVPVIGLGAGILVVTGALMAGFYSPGPVLLILALTTFAAGVLRRWQIAVSRRVLS